MPLEGFVMHTHLFNPRLLHLSRLLTIEAGGEGGGSSNTETPPPAGNAETPPVGDKGNADGEDYSDDDGESFDAARTLAKIKKLNSENKNLRDAKKAAEAKAAEVDAKDQRITALEAENLRIRVGAKHGLPADLIDRLRGDTEEEVLADAEKLLALVGGRTATPPPSQRPTERPGNGGGQTPIEITDVRKLGERMFRN